MAEEYVIMPKSDYVSACNAVRKKTGKTGKIKSCDLCTEIERIESGSGNSGSNSGSAGGVLIPTNVSTLSLYNYGKTIELNTGRCLVNPEYIYGIYTIL